MKRAIWLGSSKADLKAMPEPVQDDAGHQLLQVQRGHEPRDWKPMQSIGPGVCELRIRHATGGFRVIYLATRPEAVYGAARLCEKDPGDQFARFASGAGTIEDDTEIADEQAHSEH